MCTVQKRDESLEAFRDCFETIDWQLLCESHGDDTESLIHYVMGYVDFCVKNTVATRRGQCFSNNKPKVRSELQALPNQKQKVFRCFRGQKEKERTPLYLNHPVPGNLKVSWDVLVSTKHSHSHTASYSSVTSHLSYTSTVNASCGESSWGRQQAQMAPSHRPAI